MNKAIFKKMEQIVAASAIFEYVDIYDDDRSAEVVLYESLPYVGDSKEIKRTWVRTVAEMRALLAEWEVELHKRGIVR